MSVSRPSVPHLRPVAGGGASPSEIVLAESELVTRATAGDGAAWARLYYATFDRLFRDVLYLVERSSLAEDLVQETYAAALVGLPRFDGRSSFMTWLRGIAHNLVRKHWRGKSRRGRAYERLAHTVEASHGDARDPDAMHVQEQRAQVLSHVLEGLPATLREVFVLRDVQGLSVEEVATRLELSAGNVRVRATRARARIREALAGLGWIEGNRGES